MTSYVAATNALGEEHGVPVWPFGGAAMTARMLVQGPMFGLLDLLVPANVHGLEVLEKVESPVLFAANHTSHFDTPVLLRALPQSWRRQVAVAAAEDYFFSCSWKGAGAALAFNAFPFSRGSCAGVRATMVECKRLVEAGWSVLVYPEGTRSTNGEIAEFKPGLGLLATNLGVPVVPVCAIGLFKVLPKGAHMPKPGGVEVSFGEPLIFSVGTHYRDAARSIECAVRGLGRSMDDGR